VDALRRTFLLANAFKEGDLPLGEMLALVRAAKPGVPIGIEVFSTRLYDMPAAEAAALCAASMDRLLASEN